MMPRTCTICQHPHREAIDRALVGGAALSEVAALFRVSDDAVSRHKANHLPAKLVLAEKAEEAGELRTALGAIREARSNLELLAKLLGELDERPVVNVLVSPQWLELRALIIAALERHPQARESVLRAVEGAGSG